MSGWKRTHWAALSVAAWLAAIVSDRVIPLDLLAIKWVAFGLGGIHFIGLWFAIGQIQWATKGSASDV